MNEKLRKIHTSIEYLNKNKSRGEPRAAAVGRQGTSSDVMAEAIQDAGMEIEGGTTPEEGAIVGGEAATVKRHTLKNRCNRKLG